MSVIPSESHRKWISIAALVLLLYFLVMLGLSFSDGDWSLGLLFFSTCSRAGWSRAGQVPISEAHKARPQQRTGRIYINSALVVSRFVTAI